MSAVIEISDLKIYQGSDFEQDFQLYDENGNKLNLTGCQVVSKIRKYPRSKLFNTFDVFFVNRVQGLIRLLLSNEVTGFLTVGRNCFDVLVIYPNGKIKPAITGTILVEESPTTGFVDANNLGDLGDVNTENLEDGEVLMFNQDQQQLEFVNPDEVLNKAAEDGLPEDFVEEVATEMNDQFNIDFGEY